MPVRLPASRVVAALLCAGALTTGCGTALPAGPESATGANRAGAPAVPAWYTPDPDDLTAYADCAALDRDLAKRQAAEVMPRLVRDLSYGGDATVAGFASGSLDVGSRAPGAPDRFASDGSLLVHADSDTLRVYDVAGPAPVARGTLDLAAAGMGAGQVLLSGSRALLIGRKAGPAGGGNSAGRAPSAEPPPEPPGPTWLALVDLADPDHPRFLSLERTEAGFLSARVTGMTARVVTAMPAPFGGRPWRQVFDGHAEEIKPAPEVACTDIARPAGPSGGDLLLVETLDLARDDAFTTSTTAGVVGGAIAYESPAHLYVATPSAHAGDHVGLHQFTAGPADVTTYTGSADVAGYLHGAWAMSERAGHLRVLASDRPSPQEKWIRQADEKPPTPGTARVVVLDVGDGEPRQVGQSAPVPDTLSLADVRWVDELALVGAEHHADPRRVVDLADPAHPAVRGSLSTDGTFEYVHPVGDARLLAIGTLPGGRAEDGEPLHMGLQAAILDLDDPSEPQRASYLDFGIASTHIGSEAGQFAYDPERRLGVFAASFDVGENCPRGVYCLSGGDEVPERCRPPQSCAGLGPPGEVPTVVAVRAGRDGRLAESGRWTGGEVYRIVPLGDRLALVDYLRITLVDAETLTPTGALVTGDLNAKGDDFPSIPNWKPAKKHTAAKGDA